MSKKLIQVGCNVGDEYIFDLVVKEKINLCIFIDANKSALEKCKEYQEKFFEDKDINTRSITFEYINCAVSNVDASEIELFIPKDDICSSAGSIYLNVPTISEKTGDNVTSKEVLEYKAEKFDTIIVQNFSINDIFEDYELEVIDYLFIDVEGCDKEIILSMEWDKYFIRNVQFEFTHWDGYQSGGTLGVTLFSLLMMEYKLHQSSPTDIFATKTTKELRLPDPYFMEAWRENSYPSSIQPRLANLSTLGFEVEESEESDDERMKLYFETKLKPGIYE